MQATNQVFRARSYNPPPTITSLHTPFYLPIKLCICCIQYQGAEGITEDGRWSHTLSATDLFSIHHSHFFSFWLGYCLKVLNLSFWNLYTTFPLLQVPFVAFLLSSLQMILWHFTGVYLTLQDGLHTCMTACLALPDKCCFYLQTISASI